MQGIPRIHYRPREAATYEAPIDILIPALMKLRKCDDSLKALVLVDSLPDIILPALAYAASHKMYVPAVAVKTVVKWCGPDFLTRTLGRQRARNLQARYAPAARRVGFVRYVVSRESQKALQHSRFSCYGLTKSDGARHVQFASH